MEGTVIKTPEGWMVEYMDEHPWCGTYQQVPLHPFDVNEINEAAKMFDDIEGRIRANPRITFELLDGAAKITQNIK